MSTSILDVDLDLRTLNMLLVSSEKLDGSPAYFRAKAAFII